MEKKDRAKLRMLNIEAVAAGLMKLTMQVNSLLEVQPPPPPPPPPRSVLLTHWSLRGELQGWLSERARACACVRACSQVAMHGGF